MSEGLDHFADALAFDEPRRTTDHEVTVDSSRVRVAFGWRETIEIDAVRDADHAGPGAMGVDSVLHVLGHRDYGRTGLRPGKAIEGSDETRQRVLRTQLQQGTVLDSDDRA